MNPKLPLDGRIYMLTVGSVLSTHVSQTNLLYSLLIYGAAKRISDCSTLRPYQTDFMFHGLLRLET